MSITSIMGTGLSALMANQQALNATSTNVANVNTEGYSRQEVHFLNGLANGRGGVRIDIQRVANAYLAAAEIRGAGDVAAAQILADFMDRAQGLLGDPSEPGSVFSSIDPVMQAFGALSVDPASALRRSSALSELQTLLSQLDTTQSEIAALRDEANRQGTAIMEEANALMSGIARLNSSIQRATISGLSSAEAQTEQSRLIDRLSEIVDIRTAPRQLGGVEVRTGDGILLVDLEAARLAYSTVDNGAEYRGVVLVAPHSTTETQMASHLRGGQLLGLLRARDQELVNLGLAFAEFSGGVAEAINAAHNAGSAVPAPATLAGKNTGLLGTDLMRFSGATNIGIVDSDGLLVRNYRVDFTAGTITDDLGTVTAIGTTIANFEAALNTAMNPSGSATFVNGALTVNAAGGNGVVVADDPTAPASRVGRGFAQTFGLNDLITKSKPLNYATGLRGTDANGFAGDLVLAVRNENGAIVRSTPPITIAPGTSIDAMLVQINTALSGYGTATIDNTTGRLTISPVAGNSSRIDVLQDSTTRGTTNTSLSDFFGLGETAPMQRASSLTVRANVLSNPALMSTAKADLAGTVVTTRVLAPGDGRGALGLEAAGSATIPFQSAGNLPGQGSSISDYAARLAGHAALRSQALDSAATAAQSIRNEVSNRRMGEEGVNLDEELVKMTSYQQAYSAASRMIQAARDLYDIILAMV